MKLKRKLVQEKYGERSRRCTPKRPCALRADTCETTHDDSIHRTAEPP